MSKFRFWQFTIIMAVGFTLGAAGTQWYIKDRPEDAGSSPSIGIVEADFQLPEYDGDLFTPQKAVYDGDKLVLTLRSNVLHPEPIEDVTLTEGSERGTVMFNSVSDGEFNVIVTDPPANIDSAVLKLPAVSIEHESSISVGLDSATFTGPEAETYTFTYRGVKSDTGQERLVIDYEPDNLSAPSISIAKIQAGEDSVYAIRAGGKFDSQNRFTFGRLVFPIEAQELMEHDDGELVITQYSEIVRNSVAMPVGLVSEGTGSNGTPSEPGSGSESPTGPTGNTGN